MMMLSLSRLVIQFSNNLMKLHSLITKYQQHPGWKSVNCNCLAVDNKTKFLLMENNKPPTGFKFPAKQYKDKQKKGGVIHE